MILITVESGMENDSDWSTRSRGRRRRDTNRLRRHNFDRSPQRLHMKPEKFNGNGNFEAFLAHFQNCAVYNRWNDSDKAAHLRWSLSRTAAQLLCGSEHLCFDELMDKLKRRFSGKGMEEKFQTELRCRRRKQSESLRELAQDISRLLSLAYPGNRSELAEHLARDAFLSALNDPDLELKVREREPRNLDETVSIAQRIEIFKKTVESSNKQRYNRQVYDDDSVHDRRLETRVTKLEESFNKPQKKQSKSNNSAHCSSVPKEICASRSDNDAHIVDQEWIEMITKKIAELEKDRKSMEQTVTKLSEENEMMDKEIGRLRHLQQLRSKPTVQQSDQKKVPAQEQREVSRRTICFVCREEGHIARNCPNRHRGIEAEQVNTGHVNKMSRSQNGSAVGAVYLKAKVNEIPCSCLLDTGSDVTLLPWYLVKEQELNNTDKTLSAANETPIQLLGVATVPFVLGDYSSSVTGLVTTHVTEVMLGIDWLSENEVAWEFNRNRIRFRGRFVQLHRRTDINAVCRRVILQSDVVIPPKSETDLPVSVILNKIPVTAETDYEWEQNLESCRTEFISLVPLYLLIVLTIYQYEL